MLKFETGRVGHAIEEFSATIQFFQPVGALTFQNVAQALEAAAKKLNLPAVLRQQSFTFALGSAPTQTPGGAAGLGYAAYAPTGEVFKSITCDASSIRYSIRDYDGWEKTLEELKFVFSTIIPSYIQEMPAIVLISLSYLNLFRAIEKNQTNFSEIFKLDSGLLPAFAFQAKDAWHSHIGYFESIEAGSRHLLNANIDTTLEGWPNDPVSGPSARLLIFATEQFDVTGQRPLIVEKENYLDTLAECLERIHNLEKSVLRATLSNDYLDLIGDFKRDH